MKLKTLSVPAVQLSLTRPEIEHLLYGLRVGIDFLKGEWTQDEENTDQDLREIRSGVAGIERVLERIEEVREQLAKAKRAQGGSGASVTNERHGTRPKPKSRSLDGYRPETAAAALTFRHRLYEQKNRRRRLETQAEAFQAGRPGEGRLWLPA